MIAPMVRRPVPAGFTRLSAGDVTRAGQVAGADRPSLACGTCGEMVPWHAPTVAGHRRKHAVQA